MTVPSKEEILTRVARILHDDFKVAEDKVTPQATFGGTFGLDSLDIVDFIFFLQKEFGIKAELEDYRDLHTVRKLVDFVHTRLGGG